MTDIELLEKITNLNDHYLKYLDAKAAFEKQQHTYCRLSEELEKTYPTYRKLFSQIVEVPGLEASIDGMEETTEKKVSTSYDGRTLRKILKNPLPFKDLFERLKLDGKEVEEKSLRSMLDSLEKSGKIKRSSTGDDSKFSWIEKTKSS